MKCRASPRPCGKRPGRSRRAGAAVLAVALCLLGPADTSHADGPELWFLNRLNLQGSTDGVPNDQVTNALIDRAASAGYTGMVLADFKLQYPTPLDPWLYVPRLHSVLDHAAAQGITVVPATYGFGYSEMILRQDKNLAEGIAVNGATFTVAGDGQSLVHQPDNPAADNTGFEADSAWYLDAGRARYDSAAAHTGGRALRIDAGGGRGYAVQTLDVQPYRQYHVSVWIKTAHLTDADMHVCLYDAVNGVQRQFNSRKEFDVAPNQDWQRYDFVANSNYSTQLQLRVGTWSGSSGTAWFDDVQVEEVALHNLVKAGGSPLRVYRPDGSPLVEGVDVDPVEDPGGFQDGVFSIYHTPPTVTISNPASRLQPGETVRMDYYAVSPIYGYQNGSSLTEPAVGQYMADNINVLRDHFPDGTGYMLNYDEIRQMNTSAGAKATGMTAGELLAWHFAQACATVRSADGTAPIYVWSDMFDPFHNAHDKYYMVDGDIAGSWEGVPPDVTIMNWNHLLPTESLQWFADRGHRQIISGYYDGGDGEAAALREVAWAEGIDGILGLMYTTWRHDYSELEDYASAFHAAWPDAPCPGDANRDGRVDYIDLGLLASRYGGTDMGWTDGDFTGDGAVTYLDLGILASHYGWAAPPPQAAPEPAAALLLAAGAAGALVRRRHPFDTSMG